MKLNRLSVVALGLMALAIVAAFYFQPEAKVAVGTPTAVATPTTPAAISANQLAVDTGATLVLAEGLLSPARHQTLTFNGSGLLTDIFVAEGDWVEAGDPLLQIDGRDQENALIQQQAALTQAEANVALAQADHLIAETGVTAATIALEIAQVELRLLEEGPTAAQVALYEALLAAAESGVAQAASNQNLALAQPATSAIRSAQARLAAAQAEVVPAQIALDQLVRDNGTQANIQQAQLKLNAAIANVNAAQIALQDVQAGASAPVQSASAAQVTAADANRQVAQAQLELLLLGSRTETIALTEAKVAQAQTGLTEANLLLQQATTAVEGALAQVDEAVTAVAAAENALHQRTLYAPFSGTVAQMNLKIGELMTPETTAVILADFQQWQVKTTNVTEVDIVALAQGFPVEITVDAFPGQPLNGRVADIAAVSEIVRGDVTYEVTISIDELSLPVRWGMRAFVAIDVAQ